MKTRLSVIAVLTLSSQLTFAEQTIEATAVNQPTTATVQPAEATATDSQIKALEHDLSPSLQTKLDALMGFEAEPAPMPRQQQEVASAH